MSVYPYPKQFLKMVIDDSIEMFCAVCGSTHGPNGHALDVTRTHNQVWLEVPGHASVIKDLNEEIRSKLQLGVRIDLYFDEFLLLPSTSVKIFDFFKGVLRVLPNRAGIPPNVDTGLIIKETRTDVGPEISLRTVPVDLNQSIYGNGNATLTEAQKYENNPNVQGENDHDSNDQDNKSGAENIERELAEITIISEGIETGKNSESEKVTIQSRTNSASGDVSPSLSPAPEPNTPTPLSGIRLKRSAKEAELEYVSRTEKRQKWESPVGPEHFEEKGKWLPMLSLTEQIPQDSYIKFDYMIPGGSPQQFIIIPVIMRVEVVTPDFLNGLIIFENGLLIKNPNAAAIKTDRTQNVHIWSQSQEIMSSHFDFSSKKNTLFTLQ